MSLTKEALLDTLQQLANSQNKAKINFTDLAVRLHVSKEELDRLLHELEVDRKINQFIIRSSDDFLIHIL